MPRTHMPFAPRMRHSEERRFHQRVEESRAHSYCGKARDIPSPPTQGMLFTPVQHSSVHYLSKLPPPIPACCNKQNLSLGDIGMSSQTLIYIGALGIAWFFFKIAPRL